MTPELFLNGRVQLFHGDSRKVLKKLLDNSVDSVCTDPPYALVSIVKRFGGKSAAPAKGGVYARASKGFMGQDWDTGSTAFDPKFWREVLRVLKPGGYVLAASGTRTYHRLACAVEDAGFEIRDMLQWLYGSGFPKSHAPLHAMRSLPRTTTRAEWYAFYRIAREMTGSALKPACEPWVFARKPIIGTLAANVCQFGTGAMNIDGCRISTSDQLSAGAGVIPMRHHPEVPRGRSGEASAHRRYAEIGATNFATTPGPRGGDEKGRWPANVIHDGSDEIVGLFPEAPGQQRAVTGMERSHRTLHAYGNFGATRDGFEPRGDEGSAARFFYSAKADANDRLGSGHPTVKPIDLMQYFCRLVTPPGGVVLDMFAGTGTTGEAAWREGFSAILIERDERYCEDIRRRLSLVLRGPATRRAAAVKRKSLAPAPLFEDLGRVS